MKLRTALVGTLALMGLALVGPASPAASAAPAYPPHTCPTLSLSTTHPAVGEQITVSGQQFDVHARVSLVLLAGSHDLRSVTTDSNGSFTTQVRLPAGVTGAHTIKAKGAQSACPAESIQLLIEKRTAENAAVGGPGSTPAMTGVDVGGLLVAAAALIGVGLLLNRRRTSRRRHHSV